MPTHMTKCVVCEQEIGCCQVTHALSCGGLHGEGGCDNPPYIEFCSLECFFELRDRLDDAMLNYATNENAEGIQLALRKRRIKR